MTFLKREIVWVDEIRPAHSVQAATSSGASSSGIDQPSGDNAAWRITVWKRDLREVSAYSTVCPEPAREAAYSQRPRSLNSMPSIPRYSIRHHLKLKSDRPPRFRKACNLPVLPRLPTASCPSTRVSISVGNALNPKSFSRQPRTLNPSVPTVHLPRLQCLPGLSVAIVFLLFDDNEAVKLRQRNFDIEPLCSCCHEFQPGHRLETPLTRTPPPICTFAPDTQTALIWRTVGRRERVKKYTMRNF
jgi:hypothetical protein